MLFATTDKGARAEVASDGSADFVLVQVGTTVAPIVTHQVEQEPDSIDRRIVDVEEWVPRAGAGVVMYHKGLEVKWRTMGIGVYDGKQ